MSDSMKNSLTLLIRRAPYGQIHAAEALRHMGGAMGDGIRTNVLLVDDGVYVARDGHNPGETGFSSLVDPLAKGIAQGARVYMHIPSAQARGLLPLGPAGSEGNDPHLIAGVDCIDDDGFAHLLAESEMVMVY